MESAWDFIDNSVVWFMHSHIGFLNMPFLHHFYVCVCVCVCAFVCVDSSSQVLSEHQNILNVAVKFTYFLRCGSRYRWEWVCYANGYTFFYRS